MADFQTRIVQLEISPLLLPTYDAPTDVPASAPAEAGLHQATLQFSVNGETSPLNISCTERFITLTADIPEEDYSK